MIDLKIRPGRFIDGRYRPMRVRMSAERFLRMTQQVRFVGRRVELVRGEVIEMPPQGEPQGLAVNLVRITLEKVFGTGFYVRSQQSLRVSQKDLVDPDLAVVEGDMMDWATRQIPSTALLVVEVSDSTLRYDQKVNAPLYALAKVPEYWVIDLNARQMIVHRDATEDASSRTGFRYASIESIDESQSITPLARPGGNVSLSSMLPRKA